jgi:hypothetical protein
MWTEIYFWTSVRMVLPRISWMMVVPFPVPYVDRLMFHATGLVGHSDIVHLSTAWAAPRSG